MKPSSAKDAEGLADGLAALPQGVSEPQPSAGRPHDDGGQQHTQQHAGQVEEHFRPPDSATAKAYRGNLIAQRSPLCDHFWL